MPFARLGLVALALVLLLSWPASASAAPCWRAVVADWSDGRIDREYPTTCYRAALQRLPEDLRVYGSAEADIHRELLSAVRRSASGRLRPSESTSSVPWEPGLLSVIVAATVLAALASRRRQRLG